MPYISWSNGREAHQRPCRHLVSRVESVATAKITVTSVSYDSHQAYYIAEAPFH